MCKWRARAIVDDTTQLTLDSIAETNVSLICSSMPAFASLPKTHASSLSYLSDLRDRLLSSLHPSNLSSTFKVRSSHDSIIHSTQTQKIPSTSSDTSHIAGRGYVEFGEHYAFGQRPQTNVRSSSGGGDVELGEIQKTVSLEQLVTKAV